MTSATRVHVVRSGDTLSAIARRYGTSLRALTRANGIRNVNLIHIGQRLIVPGAAAAPATGGGSTRMSGSRLSLSAADILNLKKTLQTEWAQYTGVQQAHGILDTILNRTASGHWGSTVADVVNARNQFSDINGPISRKKGRGSVEEYPASGISQRVHQVTDEYLAARAAGQASSVGTHLNYANPHHSDARNLPWIRALSGPVFGRGESVHHHGTTPDLERHRPAPYTLALPGTPAPQSSGRPAGPGLPPAGRRINGNEVAASNGVQVKSGAVAIGHLDPAMAAAIRAVSQAARQLELPTPVITSGNDSRHMRGSLHYADRALDFRGNNITVAQGRAFQNAVRQSLGSRYDVEFEVFSNSTNNHLHVEYDPD